MHRQDQCRLRGWRSYSAGRLAACLLISLAVLLSNPQSARAQTVASLTVAPSVAQSGDAVTLSGQGHPPICSSPLATVYVLWPDGTELTRSDAAGVEGEFTAVATVSDVAAGDYVLSAACGTTLSEAASVATASAVLTVIAGQGEVTNPDQRPRPAQTRDVIAAPRPPPSVHRQEPMPRSMRALTRPQDTQDQPDEVSSSDPSSAESTDLGSGGAADQPEMLGDETAPSSELPEQDGLEPRWAPAKTVAPLADLELSPIGVTSAAFNLTLFSLLIGFPATLFNGTLRTHYDELTAGLRRRLPRASSVNAHLIELAPRLPLVGMVFAGALAAALLDPTLGPDLRSASVVAGLAVTVGLAGWLGWLPTKRTSDRYGNEGRYRAYPIGLFVALVCVTLSRGFNIEPGYLYGLLFAYDTRGRWTAKDDGWTFAQGFAVVFVVGLLAWATMPITAAWADVASPSGLAIAADTATTGLALVGIEGVVFGMIPFRFAPGHAVWTWNRRVWWAVYVPAFLAFASLLSSPDRELFTVSSDASVRRAAIAFMAYSAFSGTFWLTLRRRDRRQQALTAGVEPDGESLDESTAAHAELLVDSSHR